MCGFSIIERRTSEDLRKLVGTETITAIIPSGWLRWYGYVMRKNYEDWVKNVWRSELQVEDQERYR